MLSSTSASRTSDRRPSVEVRLREDRWVAQSQKRLLVHLVARRRRRPLHVLGTRAFFGSTRSSQACTNCRPLTRNAELPFGLRHAGQRERDPCRHRLDWASKGSYGRRHLNSARGAPSPGTAAAAPPGTAAARARNQPAAAGRLVHLPLGHRAASVASSRSPRSSSATRSSSAIVRIPALIATVLLVPISADAAVRVWRSAWAWLPVDRGRGLFRFVWAAVLAGYSSPAWACCRAARTR